MQIRAQQQTLEKLPVIASEQKSRKEGRQKIYRLLNEY